MPKIHLFRSLDSTNLEALRHQHDAEHGDAWLADHQTAGRGRRHGAGQAREWLSPQGVNVYLSVIVLANLNPEKVPFLTLIVGAKIAELLCASFPLIAERLWLKWPNDLYIDDRKVAGILTEGLFSADGFRGAVIGTGINANLTAEAIAAFPSELSQKATSLAVEMASPIDRLKLAIDLRDACVAATDLLACNPPAQLMQHVLKFDRTAGRKVQFRYQDKMLTGVAQGVSPSDGALQICFNDNGRTEVVSVTSGEVHFLP